MGAVFSGVALDPVAVVECGYRLSDSVDNWLGALGLLLKPALDDGLGVAVVRLDPDREGPEVVRGTMSFGMNPALCELLPRVYTSIPAAMRGPMLRSPTALSAASALLRASLDTCPIEALAEAARRDGFVDSLGFNVSNPTGEGFLVGVPRREVVQIAPPLERRWKRVAAHLAAGFRLQLAWARAKPEAVLSPGGKVLHAEPAAAPALGVLREQAQAIERARGPLRRNPEQALEGWSALVAGRWSLIDRFEADGRRFLVAMPNPPGVIDPRGLSEGQKLVATYAALGHSNKQIAYLTGIAEGTVSAQIHRASRKLGVASRAELVSLLASWQGSDDKLATPLQVGDVELVALGRDAPRRRLPLTERQLVIARAAAAGEPNAAIAQSLGCSQHTVANTLARVFRKLGVSSRAELARLTG